jgi:hypothetical protein
MFLTSSEATKIAHCVNCLNDGYQRFHHQRSQCAEYADILDQSARFILRILARSNAPYHNLDHTVLVTLTGQEILRGKQLQAQAVTDHDWFHFILSLLCHDVGYVRGVCQTDRVDQHSYAMGVADGHIGLTPTATDASLAAYHVDRSKQFVQEAFRHHPQIDIATIQHYIELTRFPIAPAALYQDTKSYAGLARTADLVGQLSDPNYLDKLPDLFNEFAETGVHQALGYHNAQDVKADYPRFFRQILPYLQDGLDYLDWTGQGRQILANLYHNVAIAEQPATAAIAQSKIRWEIPV